MQYCSRFMSFFNRASLGVTVLALSSVVAVHAGRATRVSAALWANGELYDTVGTDTAFKNPPPQSLDKLYNFDASGLSGQRSVSESAPGDRDFNGGRWSVMAVTFTDAGLAALDMDGDGQVDVEMTSEEDVMDALALELISITPANVYFECPVLHRHGN